MPSSRKRSRLVAALLLAGVAIPAFAGVKALFPDNAGLVRWKRACLSLSIVR